MTLTSLKPGWEGTAPTWISDWTPWAFPNLMILLFYLLAVNKNGFKSHSFCPNSDFFCVKLFGGDKLDRCLCRTLSMLWRPSGGCGAPATAHKPPEFSLES